jgi:Carboxypeptidase regulatory-like domain/TonB dependent receptor-like, beta-barrel
MRGALRRVLCLVVVMTAWATATSAFAQFAYNSSIDGRVVDESGGALPGVAVTLSSPALQVAQSATTDGEGRYRFLELPAGVYSLRYELSGFQSVIRNELRLSVAFAARVDLTLKIGGLEESITVSGASPIVDLTTTSGGQTLSQEMVTRLIPTSKFHSDLARMTPGLINSTPPQTGSLGTEARGSFRSYGISGLTVMVDGMDVRSNTAQDFGAGQEIDIRTFGNSAEQAAPGTVFNIVTKSGGNDFSGGISEQHINGKFQSENLDDALRAQGVSQGDGIKYFNDFALDLGGRILRDKLWFYQDYRDRRNNITILGLAADPGPDGKYGTGDETPYYPKISIRNTDTKLTYQATRNYQLIGFLDATSQLNDGGNNRGVAHRLVPYENGQYQTYDPSNWRGELRGTLRNNLLMNVQFGRTWYTVDYQATPSDNSNRNKTTRLDRETGIYSGGVMGTGNSEVLKHRVRYISQANLTWVPTADVLGNHEIKSGYRGYLRQQENDIRNERPVAGNYILVYDRSGNLSGQPAELWTYNLPINTVLGTTTNLGAFVTDRWRLSERLTFNVGVRWDKQSSFVPAQCKEQGQFGNSGCYPRVDAENLTAISPRFAAAYDVTGKGKTVVKATWGRFVDELDDTNASIYNQNNLIETRYRWRDLDGNNNYTPGEVNLSLTGPDFVQVSGSTNNIFNPALKSARLDQATAEIDHELMANTSLRVLYVYNRDRLIIETVNALRPYSAYNIPITRRDPGPDGILNNADDGGKVTFYDYDSAFRGATFTGNMRTNRSTPDTYNTLEVTLNRRNSTRWGALTSFSATKNHQRIVDTALRPTAQIATPNDDPYSLNLTWDWVYKAVGNYRLPGDVMVSGVFDLVSGTAGQRTYVFRSADPDGGTPLRQLSTVTLRLEPYGSERTPIKPGMNFRGSKFLKVGSKGELQLAVDFINVFNSNAVWAATYASGPTFANANTITKPRFVQFVTTYRF